jgi:hypothetical protein
MLPPSSPRKWRRHNPEELNLNLHRSESLKSPKLREFENRVLKRIFEPRSQEVI